MLSPVLIPTTESNTIVVAPAFAAVNTVLVLVTSLNSKIASLTETAVELTVVVVPSTCSHLL